MFTQQANTQPKSTNETLEQVMKYCQFVFVNFEHISHQVLVFALLTLGKYCLLLYSTMNVLMNV